MQNLYAILGVIFLVFLLVKAWHLWRSYRSTLRMKIEPVPGGDVDVPERNAEIVGPTRVVSRSVASHVEARSEALRELSKPMHASGPSDVSVEPELIAELRTADQSPLGTLSTVESQNVDAPTSMSESQNDMPRDVEPAAVIETAAVKKAEQADLFAHEVVSVSAEKNAGLGFDTKAVEPVSAWAESSPGEHSAAVEVEDFIAVHVVARSVPFHGEDLLRAILSYGLRYGEMSIFHRHEMPTGQGAVLFSMAQAVEPGTFDLHNMANDMIPGVTFFLSLPGINRIGAYDIMMDTAKRLATEFNADMLDQNQALMTRQLLEHYRERVVEFERKRMTERRQ